MLNAAILFNAVAAQYTSSSSAVSWNTNQLFWVVLPQNNIKNSRMTWNKTFYLFYIKIKNRRYWLQKPVCFVPVYFNCTLWQNQQIEELKRTGNIITRIRLSVRSANLLGTPGQIKCKVLIKPLMLSLWGKMSTVYAAFELKKKKLIIFN